MLRVNVKNLRTSPSPDDAPVIKTTFPNMFSLHWKYKQTELTSSQTKRKGETRSKSNKKT